MEKLFKQLKRNTHALSVLSCRYKQTQELPYYVQFGSELERIQDLEWILKVRKRVLRMRYRILENIQMEITKDMQDSSTQMRELNLKVA